jgi:hypothetical protein
MLSGWNEGSSFSLSSSSMRWGEGRWNGEDWENEEDPFWGGGVRGGLEENGPDDIMPSVVQSVGDVYALTSHLQSLREDRAQRLAALEEEEEMGLRSHRFDIGQVKLHSYTRLEKVCVLSEYSLLKTYTAAGTHVHARADTQLNGS